MLIYLTKMSDNIPATRKHCGNYFVPKHLPKEFSGLRKELKNISDEDGIDTDKFKESKVIQSLLRKFFSKEYIKYGDLVIFEKFSGYRNDGIFIYDSHGFHPLDDNIDDYGALPTRFKVFTNGRPANYWTKNDEWIGIDHNNYVFFDHHPYKDEILANIQVGTLDGYSKSICTYSFFKKGNKKYYIVLEDDENEDKDERKTIEEKLEQEIIVFSHVHKSDIISYPDLY